MSYVLFLVFLHFSTWWANYKLITFGANQCFYLFIKRFREPRLGHHYCNHTCLTYAQGLKGLKKILISCIHIFDNRNTFKLFPRQHILQKLLTFFNVILMMNAITSIKWRNLLCYAREYKYIDMTSLEIQGKKINTISIGMILYCC